MPEREPFGSSTRWIAVIAALCLGGVYLWADGGRFGPTSTTSAGAGENAPVPLGGDSEESEAEDRLLRANEFYAARAFPNDEIPLGAIPRAQAEANELDVVGEVRELTVSDTVIADRSSSAPQTERALAPVNWTQVGTAGTTALGGTSGATTQYNGTVPLSGRVVGIANHPTDANTAYIAAASGGVFKTTNGGTTWTGVFDAQPSLAMGAIAIDPGTPTTIYAGTGESDGGLFSYYYGLGLFKSVDAGANWTRIGTTQFDYCHISDIVVLPGTNTVVVSVSSQASSVKSGRPGGGCQSGTASSTGIWRSVNGGSTWTFVASTTGVSDLAIDPNDATTIYAGDYQFGILYSNDSGATWFFNNAVNSLSDRGRVELAVAGTPTVLYAAFERKSNRLLLGIHRSTDKALNWSFVSNPQVCSYPGATSGQCNYDFSFAADPSDSSVLFLAGIYLGRSTDSGATFSYVGNDPGNASIRQTHVDNQYLSFDANNRLWLGTDGGIYRTSDGANFTNLNGTLNFHQFQHGISASASGKLWGGTQDLGSARYTTGPGWTMFLGGDGGATAVDPTNENIVFGSYIRLQTYKSTNGGVANTLLSSADCLADGNSNCLFYAPMVMDSARPGSLYLGTRRVWRTTNSWATAPVPISSNFGGRVSAIAPAASSSNVVYAGTDNGELHVTLNADAATPTWTNRAAGLPTRWITDILVDPSNSNRAWVTLSGFDASHVWTTSNAGLTWTSVSSTLANIPVNAIDADFRVSPPHLYVGTDIGVFASDNSGATWARYGTGLPSVVVLDVLANSAMGKLVAGTAARGMWTTPLGCAPPPNDNLANAAVLGGLTATATEDNTCAGAEIGEPSHDDSNPNPASHSLWWQWTAPSSGQVVVDTEGSDVSDTVLGVYTGSSVTTLTVIGRNDDSSAGGLLSRLAFTATAGQVYKIAVDGHSASQVGNVTINLSAQLLPTAPRTVSGSAGAGRVAVFWAAPLSNGGSPITGYVATASPSGATCATAGELTCTVTGLTNGTAYTFTVTATNAIGTGPASTSSPPVFPLDACSLLPSNDDFANADELNGLATTDTEDNTCATAEPGEPRHFPTTGAPSHSLWWHWTAPRNGRVVVDTEGSVVSDTVLGVYTGTNVTALTVIGQDDFSGSGLLSRVEFAAIAGQRYMIAVDGFDPTELGLVAVNLAATLVPTPPLSVSGVVGNGQVAVSWTAPSSNGGSTITGYLATASPGGATCATTGAVTCTVTGLTNGTAYTFTVTATNTVGTGTPSAASPAVTPVSSMVALSPARLMESRVGEISTVDELFWQIGQRPAGSTTELTVTNRGGIAADAAAVVLNIAVTDTQGGGYITAYPCGTTRPTASNLNYLTGHTIANAVIAKVGTNGKVCLYTSTATHLIVDANGYFPAGSSFAALSPARLMESRVGEISTVDELFWQIGQRPAGSTTELTVTNRGGIAADAAAVVLNIAVTDTQGGGYITAYPCGTTRPTASNLNYLTGHTIANAVIAKVGTNGKVCLYTSTATHLIVDANGYFPAGSSFAALSPARLMESRVGEISTVDELFWQIGQRPAGSTTELTVTNRGGIAADAAAVVLNIAVTDTQGGGYITAYPCGTTRPTASNLNYLTGHTIANAVIAKVGTNGKVCLYTSTATHLIVDANGYFPTS